MFEIIRKLLTYAGILLAILFSGVEREQAVPNNFEDYVEYGGTIEEKYLGKGAYEVSYMEEETTEDFKKYEVFYPSDIKDSDEIYPVIVVANGTGTAASRYIPLFEHYASWGFVVIGNEDEGTWDGKSVDKCLSFLLNQNDDKNSLLYKKLDLNNIGITGHSQGGVAVINEITRNLNRDLFKTAVILSPVGEELSAKLGWNYDASLIKIPIMIATGTYGEFETETVIPFEQLQLLYSHINSEKVVLRKTDMGHSRMLYSACGYVTAWFMWQLKDDSYAGQAFTGDNPEIFNNELYQDQIIDLK